MQPESAVTEKVNEGFFCVGHINISGLASANYTKSCDLLHDEHIQCLDVLCITETHSKQSDRLVCSDIWKEKEGTVYRCDRSGKKGGGVAMFVSNSCQHKQIHVVSQLELLCIEVYCPVKTLIIVIYVPPKEHILNCAFRLHDVLEDVCGYEHDRILIVGDFNENLLSENDNFYFRNVLVGTGFLQHVKVPTTDYGSLLDHVYTKNICDVTVDVQDAYYSDHDKVFCFIK